MDVKLVLQEDLSARSVSLTNCVHPLNYNTATSIALSAVAPSALVAETHHV